VPGKPTSTTLVGNLEMTEELLHPGWWRIQVSSHDLINRYVLSDAKSCIGGLLLMKGAAMSSIGMSMGDGIHSWWAQLTMIRIQC
jgi:hypothetical protein